MNGVRALIAEDEEILAMTLQKTLERIWPELTICGIAENGIEAVNQSLQQFPDIVFLDIKMPGKSGLDVAEELAEEWPADRPFPLIVFVTAYDEFAVNAFDHEACDYVLKPISDVRIAKTVLRLQTKLQQASIAAAHEPMADNRELQRIIEQLSRLAPSLHTSMHGSVHGSLQGQAPERLSLIRAAVANQIRIIPIDDVLYFEATDKYINVVTAEHASLIRMSMRELLPQLDTQIFWQVHRSYIINSKYLQLATRDEAGKLSLQLRGSTNKIQVSRVYAHLFKQM
jgi:DNA-binding LytR/AlgR family response regulator